MVYKFGGILTMVTPAAGPVTSAIPAPDQIRLCRANAAGFSSNPGNNSRRKTCEYIMHTKGRYVQLQNCDFFLFPLLNKRSLTCYYCQIRDFLLDERKKFFSRGEFPQSAKISHKNALNTKFACCQHWLKYPFRGKWQREKNIQAKKMSNDVFHINCLYALLQKWKKIVWVFFSRSYLLP